MHLTCEKINRNPEKFNAHEANAKIPYAKNILPMEKNGFRTHVTMHLQSNYGKI